MTLTKGQIVERVAAALDCSKSEAAELVESFFAIIKERLIAGETVKLSGFGSFRVRDKNPRPGRNPQTGETLMIEARRVVTFRPSPVLRRALGRQTVTTERQRVASKG